MAIPLKVSECFFLLSIILAMQPLLKKKVIILLKFIFKIVHHIVEFVIILMNKIVP